MVRGVINDPGMVRWPADRHLGDMGMSVYAVVFEDLGDDQGIRGDAYVQL